MPSTKTLLIMFAVALVACYAVNKISIFSFAK
jgi:hypothetical protein